MKEKESGKNLLVVIAVLVAISLIANIASIATFYNLNKESSLEGELATLMDSGSDIIMIKKEDAVCRVIGLEVESDIPIVSCFYGHRGDATRLSNGEEITNLRILAFEEIYLGGTFTEGVYNYDGELIGKFRKDFKYNDNADIFWKVEVGLNGSTLEFCSMRDQEYADTSRTKESCQSLNIDIK
jgi:hypothetical protein